MPKQISVLELEQKLETNSTNPPSSFKLIDCREQDEFDYCRIEGATLIPLSQFETLAKEQLDSKDEIVIYCHHGMRSMHACLYLENLGFENTTNVVGGIEAWSLHVDPKVPRY